MRIKSFFRALCTSASGSAVLVTCSASLLAQTPTPPKKQQPPPPAAERPFNFPEHTATKLDNGLTVFVIEDHRQPLVSATLMIPGAGSSSNTPQQSGLASMTASLLRQGTTSRSAQQIAQAIDSVGGSLSASAGADTTEASVTVITSALETGFELLADIVQHPAFAPEEIERWRRQTLSSLQVAYSDPEYVRNVVGQRVAYGEHPYAFPTDGFPNTVPSLTRDDVVGFYKERFTPSGAYIAVAGDIKPDAAVAIVRKHFGSWSGAPVKPVQAAAPKSQRRIIVVDKPDAVQTQFGAFATGVPRNDPDYIPLAVANQVLGGGFNSRLNPRLRAKEGLTYGAGSSLDSDRLAGLWYATSFTRTEETANAIKLTLDVIAEFLERPAEAVDWYRGVPGGPLRAEARIRIAAALYEQGQVEQAYSEAHALQNDAASDDDARRNAYLLEGELRQRGGDAAAEIEALSRGLAAYPDDPALLYARALAWERQDRIDRTEADLRKVLVAEPENVAALNALGYTLADRTQRYQEALELIDRARTAEPDNAAIVDSYGWVLYRLGRNEEALVELRRAWGLLKDPEIGAHVGEVLWTMGRREEAMRYFEDARRLDPDNRSLVRALEKLQVVLPPAAPAAAQPAAAGPER